MNTVDFKRRTDEAIQFWKENADGKPLAAALWVTISDEYGSETEDADAVPTLDEFVAQCKEAARGRYLPAEAKAAFKQAIELARAATLAGRIPYVAVALNYSCVTIGVAAGVTEIDVEAPNRPRTSGVVPGSITTTRMGATP